MRRAIFVLLCALAVSAHAGSYTTGTFTTLEGIEYAKVDGKSLLMDVRVPDGIGTYPAIVYIHSGAWITGDRTGGPARRQAGRGYVVASIDYRLAPQYTWPAQLEDSKAAVRFLRANAARFKIDPDRIVAFGTSAGGHLAAMLATTTGRPDVEGLHLGNPQFSSHVTAVVDQYGVSDLLRLEDQKLPCYPFLNGNAAYMPPSLLMGCPIQECKEKTATANPITYVSKDDPPFLILHGMLDCLVPWKQSVILQEALEKSGVDSRLILIPNGEHGGRQFDTAPNKQAVDDFLDKHLRGPVAKKRRAVR